MVRACHATSSGHGAGVLRGCSPAEVRGRTGVSLADEGALRGRSPSGFQACRTAGSVGGITDCSRIGSGA
eukprot:9988430-Alexandrium_andersonii.AAC.1